MTHEESRRLHYVVSDPVGIALDEALQLALVVARNPAGVFVTRGRKPRIDAVFVLEAMRYDFELELTDRAEQERAAQMRTENLDRAFLPELSKTGAQLLVAH